jgi:hypothetical protein
MKQTLIAIAASVALLTASHASAQAIEGFVTGGTHRDSNREQFTGLGGGVLLTCGLPTAELPDRSARELSGISGRRMESSGETRSAIRERRRDLDGVARCC